MPKELPIAIHFTCFPSSIISFSVEPDIFTNSLIKIIFELSFIVLKKFISSEMF